MKTKDRPKYVARFKTDKFFVFVYVVAAIFFIAQFAIMFFV